VHGGWRPVPLTLCPQLSQETGARIDVEGDGEGEETALLISGSPGQVCRAKAAVHRIVTESVPVSEQLCVPQRAVGRIIGTGEAGTAGGVTPSPTAVAQTPKALAALSMSAPASRSGSLRHRGRLRP